MIKINDSIEIPGFVVHSEEFMNDREAYIKKIEQLLFAAEEILKCVPLNDYGGIMGNNIYLAGFNDALEAYGKLKKQSASRGLPDAQA